MHFRRLIELLTPRQRRSLAGLLALMFVGMVLETLSVGLVLPALTLLTRPSALPPALQGWLGADGGASSAGIFIGVLLLIGIFFLKAVLLAFLAWRQTRFVFELQADLSKRLFDVYLHRPYTFHLQRNSAELLRNVVNETNLFTHTGLLAATMFVTEMLVILGIGALLLYLEPVGALLVAAVLAAAAWSFHRLTRTRVLRWGEKRQYHEGQRIQHLQQGLGGVKDVKLLGREAAFLDEYGRHNSLSAQIMQRQIFTTQLPRLWLELLAVAGLGILVLVAIAQGRELASLLPLVGVFAAAAFRLMPSANRVFTTAQQMRFALPVVDVLHAELSGSQEGASGAEAHAPRSGAPSLSFSRELALEGVSFRYPGAAALAIDEVSLRIPRGATVGFIGGSGAGKSTLVDIVLGLLAPDGGRVTVDGVDIRTNLRGWQSNIGYVPQSIFLTDDTLRRNIAFGLPEAEIDDRKVWRALAAAQLDGFVRELSEGDRTVVGERGIRLSGGQRQRIGIARALYHDPSVLVLDEATSSLDLHTEAGVMEAVRALHGEKTILIVAHRHSTVSHCDELYRIERGRVVEAGKPQEVLQRAAAGAAQNRLRTPQP